MTDCKRLWEPQARWTIARSGQDSAGGRHTSMRAYRIAAWKKGLSPSCALQHMPPA
jgi:hypothetical protein